MRNTSRPLIKEAPKEEPLKVEPKEEPRQAPGNPDGKGAEADAPAPEGELFTKEEQGTVEQLSKEEGKAVKAPRRPKAEPKPPTGEEEEKTGTPPLVWHTIGKALLDFYDMMNQ